MHVCLLMQDERTSSGLGSKRLPCRDGSAPALGLRADLLHGFGPRLSSEPGPRRHRAPSSDLRPRIGLTFPRLVRLSHAAAPVPDSPTIFPISRPDAPSLGYPRLTFRAPSWRDAQPRQRESSFRRRCPPLLVEQVASGSAARDSNRAACFLKLRSRPLAGPTCLWKRCLWKH